MFTLLKTTGMLYLCFTQFYFVFLETKMGFLPHLWELNSHQSSATLVQVWPQLTCHFHDCAVWPVGLISGACESCGERNAWEKKWVPRCFQEKYEGQAGLGMRKDGKVRVGSICGIQTGSFCHHWVWGCFLPLYGSIMQCVDGCKWM